MGNSRLVRVTAWSLALLGAGLAPACTSTPPSKLTPQQRAAIQGRSVALHQLPSAHFALISSSSTLMSALDPFTAGANAAKSQKAGDVIVEQDHLVDPVTIIGPALLGDLKAMYGMTVPEGGAMPAPEPGSASPPTRADLVLSVEVKVWSTMYLPSSLSHYGVMLVASAQILDGASPKSLREARCIVRPRSQPDAPTFTELMENDGARLRIEVDYATEACTQALRQSLLGE